MLSVCDLCDLLSVVSHNKYCILFTYCAFQTDSNVKERALKRGLHITHHLCLISYIKYTEYNSVKCQFETELTRAHSQVLFVLSNNHFSV